MPIIYNQEYGMYEIVNGPSVLDQNKVSIRTTAITPMITGANQGDTVEEVCAKIGTGNCMH